jgi:hypothetical protein
MSPGVRVLPVALGAVDLLASVTVAAASTAVRSTRPLTRAVPVPPAPDPVQRLADRLLDRGRARGDALAALAARVLDVLVPAVVGQIVRRIDLTGLVAANVDLDAVVARVDVDAVAARLDLEAVLARVDLDLIASRLDIEAILRRVDVDGVARRLDVAAVVDRVDVDAVASRLDVEAVVRRLDLAGLAAEVIDAVDLPELIR